jgi:SAM-dependent methyltransferase
VINSLHSCPICDGKERGLVYRTRDRHYGISGEWTVARCSDCGMVQLEPMPSMKDLLNFYPSNFYAFGDLSKKNNGVLAAIKRLLFPSIYVKDPHFLQAGRVLDSGCGTGWALIKFKNAGWECVGLEPSSLAAKFGREKYHLDIREGTVNSERFPSDSFDYVRSNHSLEHDPNANETIAEFRRIIKADGKLLIGVPNIDSLPAKLFGRYWWYLGAPVHTYNFSTKHLTRLLNKHNFDVISIRHTCNYGGLLGSIQIFLNRNQPEKLSTDGFFINSKLMQILAQVLSIGINFFKQGDAIEVIATPNQYKSNN